MRVNQAILHSYAAGSCVTVFSEAPMDLSQAEIKRYVTSQARRSLSNLDARRGAFLPESAFKESVEAYFRGQQELAPFSAEIAHYLLGELGKQEHTPSTDVLVIDFEGDVDKTLNDLSDEDVEMMYEAQAPRYLAIVVLESRDAYMCEVGIDALGHQVASIARHHAILPNPGQKVSSFAVVAATGEVRFCDVPRVIAGQSIQLLPEGLLQCTSEASSKECVEAVTELVGEVADEFCANSAAAVAAAKAYVSENAEDDEVLVPEQLAREVFSGSPQAHDRFVEEAADRDLPAQLKVEPKVARRVAAKHHIRTDTGVDITFPAEFGKNPDFLEFTSNLDGTISIAIKNVSAIENR